MSWFDVSVMFRGKVVHSIIVLEKKLYWYDVVDEEGMIIVKWMVGPGCSHRWQVASMIG